MASIGRKIFFGFITLLLGIFAVFPLALFAVITFWIAVCYLALLVSFKGMGAIWRSFSQWRNSHGRNSPEAIAVRERLAARAQRIARAQSSPGSQLSNTPARSHSNRSNRTNRSNSNVSLSSLPQPDRDYEGIYSNPSCTLCTHTDQLRRRRLAHKPRQHRQRLNLRFHQHR